MPEMRRRLRAQRQADRVSRLVADPGWVKSSTWPTCAMLASLRVNQMRDDRSRKIPKYELILEYIDILLLFIFKINTEFFIEFLKINPKIIISNRYVFNGKFRMIMALFFAPPLLSSRPFTHHSLIYAPPLYIADASALSNCAVAMDKAPTCSKCKKGFSVTPDSKCASW